MKKPTQSKRRTAGKRQAVKRKSTRSSRKSGKSSPQREWVGGRFPAPVYVGADQPHQPLLELWAVDGYIIHYGAYDPNEPIPPLSESLRKKLLDPPDGLKPGRLRLNDPDWAAEVRRILPRLEVVAGPTPELEPAIDELIASLEDARPTSYLDGGHSADAMAPLFDAAAALYREAPWEVFDDDQLIEVDIPELNVSGACLCVIGALGESFGMLLFDSLEDYERMLDASEELDATGHITELNSTMTSLSYESVADLPEGMRREVQRHGWPVANATAYPVVEHRGSDGFVRTVTERELRAITACAEALVSVLTQDPDTFVDSEQQISLSHVDRSGVAVHLRSPPTALIGAYGDDDLVGGHPLDHALLMRMLDYAYARWGQRFIERLHRLFRGEFEEQLILQVGAYHMDAEGGRSLAEHFRNDLANQLDKSERRWLDAQRSAWLSLWEVTAVYPGEGVELHDLLTGETRRVTVKEASGRLTERGVLLARVVENEGEFILSGSHSRVLSPLAANDVTERMRKYLRRKSAVAPERLRQPNTVRYLIRCWQDEVEEAERAQGIAPEIRNTDGDLIVGTVDRYTFRASDKRRIEAALGEIDGLQRQEPDHYVALRERKGQRTVVGSVRLQEETLRIETNSVERADALRERTERACAGLLTHRGRSHEDALAALDRPESRPEAPEDIPPEQLDLLVQAHKRQHYESWLDEPIPALGNRTPREAARNASGRSRVDALINEIEYHEASLPPGERFDVSLLRQALGL